MLSQQVSTCLAALQVGKPRLCAGKCALPVSHQQPTPSPQVHGPQTGSLPGRYRGLSYPGGRAPCAPGTFKDSSLSLNCLEGMTRNCIKTAPPPKNQQCGLSLNQLNLWYTRTQSSPGPGPAWPGQLRLPPPGAHLAEGHLLPVPEGRLSCWGLPSSAETEGHSGIPRRTASEATGH